ncbi:MAG: ATP-binding protein [Prevotellaceae bacterium]|jgi:AAA15 family ATPase/GTPase|nr:ATP-binding protein [Prevotellaceae bacterium]
MLVNFSIRNFGSVKEKQTLSFEADKSNHLEDYYVVNTNGLRLLKLGLIYGANASGKTTILKALDFLRTLVLKPKNQKTQTFDFEPFLFDENTPTQNTVFEIEFIQNDVRYFYEVELNKEAIIREELYSCNVRKSDIFKRTTDLQNKFTKIKFGAKIKISKSAAEALENNTLWNNTVLGGFLKTNIDIEEFIAILNWFGDYLNALINPLSNLGKESKKTLNNALHKEVLVQILKKADFNIADISIKKEIIEITDINDFIENPERFYKKGTDKDREFRMLSNKQVSTENIEFEHLIDDKSYFLALDMESQGTQRYYGLAGMLLALIKGAVLFPIDELESSLHPDLFVHFLLSFLTNAKKSQIIATTHHREILNNKDIFRNDAIWITDKNNKDCATELYSLADFDTSVIGDTSNIYHAYKLGKLGGIPTLNDYYVDMNGDEEK